MKQITTRIIYEVIKEVLDFTEDLFHKVCAILDIDKEELI